MTEAEAVRVLEITRTLADGYRRQGGECNEMAAIAVSNAGYFIVSSGGFSHEAIRRMAASMEGNDAA
jgi:hypothetical protein